MILNGQFWIHYDDPTRETDALGRTKEFAYSDHFRVMNQITDVHGTKTDYGVDSMGRRTSMTVMDGGGSILRKESYQFTDSEFPAFMTRKSVNDYTFGSGPSWEESLVTDFVADSRGRIWKEIVDPGEGHLNLTTRHLYDSANNKIATIDPNNNITDFLYDELNRLVRVEFPSTDGGETRADKILLYDDNGNKHAERDEEGLWTIYLHDHLNRVTHVIRDMDGQAIPQFDAFTFKITDPGSATPPDLVTETRYNAVNSPTETIDSLGTVTRTFYDEIQRPNHVYTHYEQGDAVESTGQEAVGSTVPSSAEKTHSEFIYDQDLTGEPGYTGPIGDQTANPGSSAFNASGFKPTKTIRHDAVMGRNGEVADMVTYYAYDKVYRLIHQEAQYEVDELGGGVFAKTTTAYPIPEDNKEPLNNTVIDPRGKQVRTTTDGLGRVTMIEDGIQGSPVAVSHNLYSSTGLLWKAVDPLGRETATEYDLAGRPVKVLQPDPITMFAEEPGSPVTLTGYDANGNIISTTNPRGKVWEYKYDARNRRYEEKQPEVSNATDPDSPVPANPKIISSYDNVGNILSVTDARGNISKTKYDQAYRVTHILTNPVFGQPVTTNFDDPQGDDIVDKSVYDENGNVIEVIDGNGNRTKNAYDRLNRLIATVTDPDDGNPVDPALVLQTPANYQGNPATSDIAVTNSYDDAGNLTMVIDGEGHQTSFTYDGMSRNTKTTYDPDYPAKSRTTEFEYDGVVMTKRTDSKGQVTTYGYDYLNRLNDLEYLDRAQDNRLYTYDLVGNLLTVTYPDAGAGMNIRDCSQMYDHLNRVFAETSAGVTHLYEYDLANNRLYAEYGQTARKLVCSYDALNRLEQCIETVNTVADPANYSAQPGDRTTKHLYDLNGNITRKELPNGVFSDKEYDYLNRTLLIHDRAGETTISKFDYSLPAPGFNNGYDNVGNVLRVSEEYSHVLVNDRELNNTYDKVYRLTLEGTTSEDTAYEYDKANNRTRKTLDPGPGEEITDYAFGSGSSDYNSNQLMWLSTSAGTVNFAYDSNGNRESRAEGGDTDDYIYDYENRLVELESDSLGAYIYQYDHRTRRVNRDESGASGDNTICVFSGGLSVQEHTGSLSATPAVEYIRGSDYGGGIGGVLYTLRDGSPNPDPRDARPKISEL